MNIDYSKLFASLPKTESTQIVQPVNGQDLPRRQICECGHKDVEHELETNGTESQRGACEILECNCISFFQVSEAANEGSARAAVTELATPGDPELNAIIAEEQATLDVISKLEDEAGIPRPSVDVDTASPEGSCAHLCKCGKWWSHGAKQKCRHPEVLDQGLCMECLNGAPQKDVLEDFVEKDGKLTLTPKGIARCYNAAREDCKDMNIEQLGYHMMYLAKQIEEFRARLLQTRRMKAERIEEEVQNVPEAEREAFRQELLAGRKAAKSSRAKAEKQPTASVQEVLDAFQKVAGVKSVDPKQVKLVQGLMASMKKSAEEIVRFIND